MKSLKNLIIAVGMLAVVGGTSVNAQNLIIVQKPDGSNPRLFTNLDSAVIQADSNDYLFIGSGTYTFSSNPLYITKPLHFVGSGYNVTGSNSTIFVGNMRLGKAASGSTITGIEFQFNYNPSYDFTLDSVSNCTISRCLFGSPIIFIGTGSNTIITECIIDYYISNYSAIYPSSSVSKCIFTSKNTSYQRSGYNAFPSYMLVNNNILYADYPFYGGSSYLTIENNIILGMFTNIGHPNNSIFSNNIYLCGDTLPLIGTSNVYQNNLDIRALDTLYDTPAKIFINFTGFPTASICDFRLNAGCPGINAGTDGTDIGIYGTANPFKDGGTTAFPQILKKIIGTETNAAGQLKIDIKTEAQSR